MKTKTVSILFALVLVLSLFGGVFAQDAFDETWDEETVLTVFNDLEMVFPDMFADEDSDYLFVEEELNHNFPTSNGEVISKDVTEEDLEGDVEAKAAIDPTTGTLNSATFSPCGDGLIKFDITITKDDGTNYPDTYLGSSSVAYLRSITADVAVNDGTSGTQIYENQKIVKCSSTGGDNCRQIYFNSKGEARIKGYIQTPVVLNSTDTVTVVLHLTHSTYMTALWDVEKQKEIYVETEVTADKNNYCQNTIESFEMAGVPETRARYDENTGEARLQATVRNYQSTDRVNYVIPAEVIVDGSRYTDYTCKYTIYNTSNGAPRTDYCTFGEGIGVAANGVVRFDITIPSIGYHEGDIDFTFRVGGMKKLISGTFSPVAYPCPAETKISVMDPLKPFMTFYENESDNAIKASGAYGVYEDGVWGLYQKCGRMAYIAVRLKNSGIKDEYINLNNVAVAINGGTPISFKWVMSSVSETKKNTIYLASGEDVILIGKAHVTDAPYQLNADTSMTAAVNFLDYGLYITGTVYSDHNNTNCSVAP